MTMKNKKTITELLAEHEDYKANADKSFQAAKALVTEEATDVWKAIKKNFGELEDKFNSLEMKAELKEFIEGKLDDLAAIKELIEDKKAEMKAKAEAEKAKPKRTRTSWTPEQRAEIIKGYIAQRDAYKLNKSEESGAAYLKRKWGIENATTVNNWMTSKK